MTTKRIIFPNTIGGTYKAPGLQIAPVATPTPYDTQLASARAAAYTPAQLRQIANQQTTAQINAQLGASNASSKAEQAQFGSLADRAAGLASALGSWGAQYGANDAAAYNQAANTVGQLGTGLTGAVASDWNSALDASKASIAKTLAGQGQVTSYDPGALQSTAQYLGVTMPGTTLAQQAINGQKLGEFGAVADLANVKAVSDNFIAQAQQALQQRAAERASIITQRPELYQTALQAQRADEVQTQNHIDSLVTASQNWLQNQAKLKQDKTTADRSWLATQIGLTHIDPRTGNPTGGYTWADAAHTTVVPWTSKTQAAQNKASLTERAREFNKSVAAKAANANALGSYSESLSKQAGHLVDGKGHPFIGANGGWIAYNKSKSSSASGGKFSDSLVTHAADSVAGWKSGQTGTANGQPVIDPSSKKTYIQALQGAIALGPQTAAWQNRARAIVNAAYGSPDEIAMKAVQKARDQGLGLTDTIKALLQAPDPDLPIEAYIPVITRAWGKKLGDVKLIVSQLQQLMGNGANPSIGVAGGA